MRTEFSHPFLSFHQSITYRTATSFVPSKPWLQTGEYDHVSKPKKGHLNNWVRGVQSIQVSLSEPTTPGNRIGQQTCLRETLTIFYTCYLMQDQESTDLILDHPSHQDKCRHYIVSGKVTALTSFLLNPTTIPSTSQIWKSGHKHVIWPWYEVRCRNVGLTSTNMNATVAWWSNPGLLVRVSQHPVEHIWNIFETGLSVATWRALALTTLPTTHTILLKSRPVLSLCTRSMRVGSSI